MTPNDLPNPTRPANRWSSISAWLTLGAAFFYLAARYGPMHARDEVLYNADAMFIPVFFGDVAARGSLAGWDLPTSPFFFPDMLLFFPLLAIIPSVWLATWLFGLFQLALVGAGFIWLQRQLFTEKRAAQTWMLLALALCMIFIATGRQAVFPFAFASVHHMSVLLLMPFATVALLRTLQPESHAQRWRAFGLLCALTLVTSHSETLFIVQFVLPALGALLLFGKGRQASWRFLGLLLSGLIIAAAAGQWLRQFVVPPDKLLLYTNLEPDAIASAWANFDTWVSDLIHTDPIFIIPWCLGFVALLGITVLGIVQRHARDRSRALVATLALLSMLMSVAATVVSGNFIDAYATRYVLPTVYLPLLLGLPLGAALCEAWWRARANSRHADSIRHATVSLAAVATILVNLFSAPPYVLASPAAFTGFYEPLVTCLQQQAAQRGLRYGLAGFWQAATITALSDGQLEVLAVTNDLAPVLWNNNRLRYGAPFEFVVIDPHATPSWLLDREFITQHFGEPSYEFVCAESTVLVYQSPSDLLIHTWFAHHPNLVQLRQPGDVAELYGYTLPSRIGAVPVGLSQGASEQWDQDEGTLVLAVLKQVAAGSYVVRLDHFADRMESGEWEVVAINDLGRKTLHRAPILESGAHASTSHFDLKTAADVDIVVKYNGRGALYVDRLLLARVEPAQTTTFDFDAHLAAQRDNATTNPGALHLVYPPPTSAVADGVTDFVWQWTGAPLPHTESFEVRLWRDGESIHFGAHDAAASQEAIRRIGDTYLLRLDLSGAHSVNQHGAGDYQWTVARVLVVPAYQDLQHEAAPFTLTVQPAVQP